MMNKMIDSIFNNNSYILKYLRQLQKEIKKEHHPMPDKIKFAKPVGLEEFMK